MKPLPCRIRRFLSDNSGIAAAEFALILPILSLLVFGGYATFDMVLKDRAISRSSAIVADLTSRSQTVDDPYVTNLIAIARSLIGEEAQDDTMFDVSITSISNTFDSDSEYELEIDWSFANNVSFEVEIEDLDQYDIPFVPEGESIILVDVELRYNPALMEDFFGEMLMSEVAFRRPRFVPLVVYED